MPESLRDRDQEYHHHYNKIYYSKNKVRILERQALQKKEYLQTEQGWQKKLDANKRMIDLYPEKNKCRYTLRNAIQLGRITKEVCEVCGSADTQGHHDDYTKPFEVKWLCQQHHCELEGRWINRQ